jgi:two-component system response regulator DevR
MTANHNLQVLLVEDSPITTEQISELIRTANWIVDIHTTTTVQDALARIVEGAPPDVVVLDLQLRKESGFRVLERIARLNPKPKVAVMTNHALPKYRELALQTGAEYFLDKATDFKVLPQIIEMVAKQRAVPRD